ncbi:MAG TPA: small multi-drug export protein [Bacillota bacterium]|nr:small multi-drug export protein [Bacillota bacterium]HOG52263.1 small multi-drug export protein [Bacillota bacterium]
MFDFLNQLLPGAGDELHVLFAAMLPVMEVKGAIPVGIYLGMNPWHAALVSYIGSLLPAPLIVLGARRILVHLGRTVLLKNAAERILKRSTERYDAKYQRYGAWALLAFVAIPVPGTGVWSGSLIASVMNLRLKYGLGAIIAGNLVATVLILLLSYGVSALFNF